MKQTQKRPQQIYKFRIVFLGDTKRYCPLCIQSTAVSTGGLLLSCLLLLGICSVPNFSVYMEKLGIVKRIFLIDLTGGKKNLS